MTLDPSEVRTIAAAYADARNSGRPDRVAGCYAEDGGIAINRGTPWRGRV